MSVQALQAAIDAAWERRSAPATDEDRRAVAEAISALDRGELRVASPGAAGWIVHEWLKKSCRNTVIRNNISHKSKN